MEKRIELERRARKANSITELNLDNCRSTSIVGLSDEYTALESLSLINVGLTTLKGFPKLPNLKKLELSDNRISNGLNYLNGSPKLQYLNLSGNKFRDLETLKPLEEFKNLAILDLFNNEATQIENYREKIFAMLPTLKFLDGYDCNDVEATSEGDEDEEVNGNDSEDDDTEGSGNEESDDEDNGDFSLTEVYNDGLSDDEDLDDWEADGPGGSDDDDDDDDSDEDEDVEAEADGDVADDGGDSSDSGTTRDPNKNAAATTTAAAAAPAVVEIVADADASDKAKDAADDDEEAEESQARGKKRKHDG